MSGEIKELKNNQVNIIATLSGHEDHFKLIFAKLDEHDEKFKLIFAKLNEHDEKFKAIDKRFDKLEFEFHKLGVKFEELSHKLDLTLEVVLSNQKELAEQKRIWWPMIQSHEHRISVLEAVAINAPGETTT